MADRPRREAALHHTAINMQLNRRENNNKSMQIPDRRDRASRSKVDGWTTEQLSVGISSERFYGGIRIDGEVFNVGDCVFVNCEDRTEDQVARIDAMWEDAQGFKYFEGRWFIRPKETTCGKLDGHDDRELFLTADEFDFETATINGHCTVMPWDEYQRWQRELVEEDRVAAEEEEQDSTFVCRAFYHMGTGEFEPLTGASSLAEAARLGRRHLAAGGGGPIVARAGSAAVGSKRPRGGGGGENDGPDGRGGGGGGGGGARHGVPSSSRRMIRVLVGGYARPICMPLGLWWYYWR